MLTVEPLERVVDAHWAVEILLVPPAGDVQRRHLHAGQVRNHGLALPELVVIRVRDVVVPGGNLSVQVLRVHVRERTEAEIPVERVVAIEGERLYVLAGLHHGRVLEAVTQSERAVVVEVVAEPHIGRGRLRRDRLEGRMRLECAHDGGPSVVRHAQHAHPSVVTAHVLQQPVNGVVGVGALVERRSVALGARRALHDERAFGSELPADVLEDEDVAFVGERLEVGSEVPCGAGDAVRRPLEDDRQRPRRVPRREDLRAQPHAVARRNHHVDYFEAVGGGVDRLRLLRRSRVDDERGDEGEEDDVWGQALHRDLRAGILRSIASQVELLS